MKCLYFARFQGDVTPQFHGKMDAMMKTYWIFYAFILAILLNSQITKAKYIEGHLKTKEVSLFKINSHVLYALKAIILRLKLVHL